MIHISLPPLFSTEHGMYPRYQTSTIAAMHVATTPMELESKKDNTHYHGDTVLCKHIYHHGDTAYTSCVLTHTSPW